MDLGPFVLAGKGVRLEPLSLGHHAALTEAARDPSVGRWMSCPLASSEDVRCFIDEALRAQDSRTAIPFATVDLQSGQVVGSTRYGNVDIPNRRVEIGWTFIAPPWQRTRINTEAKYLMLRHAFEELGCVRVEFKTDALNEKSRRAIMRLGAKEEGTFRRHMIVKDGRVRDTVYFSIIESEWPAVKLQLEEKLVSEDRQS